MMDTVIVKKSGRKINIPLWYEGNTQTSYIFGTDFRDGVRILFKSATIISPSIPKPPCGVIVKMDENIATYTQLIDGAS